MIKEYCVGIKFAIRLVESIETKMNINENTVKALLLNFAIISLGLVNNVSEEILTKLVEYGDRWIRRCVAANNKTPIHIIDKLKKNHQKENPLKYYDSELLEVINNRELPELWIGPNPITPYENTEHKIK